MLIEGMNYVYMVNRRISL